MAKKSTREIFGVMEMFYILIMVWFHDCQNSVKTQKLN